MRDAEPLTIELGRDMPEPLRAEPEDPLAPARGILLGLVLGAGPWALILAIAGSLL